MCCAIVVDYSVQSAWSYLFWRCLLSLNFVSHWCAGIYPGQPVSKSAAIAAPAPAYTSTPSASSASQWETQLQQLSAMGFSDRERNIGLLETNKGDVNLVIGALIS